MPTRLDIAHIQDMANSLENEELGAAVRLLCRMLATDRPVPVHRAAVIARLSGEKWEECSPDILEPFDVVDGHIGHAALAEAQLPKAAEPEKPRAGRTDHLPIISPTRQVASPTYPLPGPPERLSIKKAAFDVMVSLFARANLSENTARSIMAGLLKNWPEGDVYEAISAADRQVELVDPKSWIVASLQRHSRPLAHSRSSFQREEVPPPSRAARRLVTAEIAGVSEKTARAIQERNKGLRLELSLPGLQT